MIELFNVDCMDYMKGLEDNAFELAIVDPPYGIERFKKASGGSRMKLIGEGLTWNTKPDSCYFNELFRVSKNQIIWGANNFILPPSEYFCIWDKQQSVDNFACAEYAWVSMGLQKPAKIFKYSFNQHKADDIKIHPTQKPIKLYQWLLKTYAKKGNRILDTHLGSGSSAIAAYYGGYDFVGCELDKHYYNAAQQRFDMETRQQALFEG